MSRGGGGVDLLQNDLDVDFSHYRTSTLARRIERRMLLGGHPSIEDYFNNLEESQEERKALCSDMLINVTHFFRDPDAWSHLAKLALTPLIAVDEPPDPVRIWVTACSTGEEAYTLAILTQEIMDSLGKSVNVKIFATDIDKDSLAYAAAGCYPRRASSTTWAKSGSTGIFRGKGRLYQISHRLRERVIFANHNITKDAPFTKMHLVTCRNVLIYMQQKLQQHVLGMLHYALHPKATLLLGSSESLGPLDRGIQLVERPLADFFEEAGRAPAAEFQTDRRHHS